MARSGAFRAARATALALTGYAALTVAYTWPLAASPGSVVPSDLGDPVLNTWILWWNAFHWPLTDAWWNAPIFFPAERTLAFSEHLLGLSPLSTPVIRLSGNALLGYNTTFLLTFVLSSTATYLLVLELTGRRDAAWLAGLAFGFAPYRAAQFPHLQMLAAYGMPIALLGLHRFLRTGGRRWLALFFGAFLLQALSNGYYLVYFPVLVALWLVWFAWGHRARAVVAALAWLAALGALLPVLLTYRDVHQHYGLTRNPAIVQLYSADLAAIISPPGNLRLAEWLPSYGTPEGALFGGFTVLGLMLAGLAVRRNPAAAGDAHRGRFELTFYACAACVLYLLALGPTPSALGDPIGVPGPYAWLARLPGFASLRVPARFGMLVMLCLAVAAGIGFARLSARWRSGRRIAAAVALSMMIAAESWPRPLSLWEPPRAWDLRPDEGRGALLVLPILNAFHEVASMYRAMSHGRPLVNGYSGHMPPWYMPLQEALNESDPAVLGELADNGVSQVALVLRNDPGGSWRDFVLAHGSLSRESPSSGFTLFDLRRGAPPESTGPPVSIVAVHASQQSEAADTVIDGRGDTAWSTVAPQAGGEQLLLDLGRPHAVGEVRLEFGRTGFDFPRELEVDVSIDSIAWHNVWNGPTAGLAVGALMRDHRQGTMRFSFGARDARYIRLRQTGRHRTAPWTVAEVRVFQPAHAR